MKIRILATARTLAFLALAPGALFGATAGPITLTIQADKPGPRINPAMWGIFFEDINLGADGGLYAELVKNRSFEFPEPMMGWFKVSPTMATGEAIVAEHESRNGANRHYLRLRSEGTAPFGVSNEGFRGIGFRKGDAYDFSTDLRIEAGSPSVTVELVGADGATLASGRLEGGSSEWKHVELALLPNDTDPKGRLNVILDGPGAIDLDMVSLFPRKTWKERRGGLRADMVQALADLHPGFLRFPGGCIVEGARLDHALPVEEDASARSPIASCSSTAGTTSSSIGRRRTTTSRSAWASSSTSSWPRTSAPSRCRSSTAAWPASSTRGELVPAGPALDPTSRRRST